MTIENKEELECIASEPLVYSYTKSHSEQLSETLLNEPCCLGIDEAGRGPVLGPMVYGVAYCPLAKKTELKQLGVDDSKKLTEEERDEQLAGLNASSDWLGWSVRVLSPQDISQSMLRKAKYNLNELSHDTAIHLIQVTLKQGVHVKEIYVDTVGSPEKYEAKLKSYFPGIKITVAKKADSLYPIVSAASICAKTTRDRVLSEWSFIEPGLNESCTREFGSGYPGDPKTKQWLLDNMDKVFGYPGLIRFSWSTCKDLLEKEAVAVEWPEPPEEENSSYHRGNENQEPPKKKAKQLTLNFQVVDKSAPKVVAKERDPKFAQYIAEMGLQSVHDL